MLHVVSAFEAVERGEERTVSGELSWLQDGSRVREGEESACGRPGLDTGGLMTAFQSFGEDPIQHLSVLFGSLDPHTHGIVIS
jgi:hypothetical protein